MKLLSHDDFCALVDAPRRTVERWRRTGDGPPFIRLPNRQVRYVEDEVMEWLAPRSRRSTSDDPRPSNDA